MMAMRTSRIARLLAGAGLAVTIGGAARAAEIKPALIYDIGGKFDKSFNEGAFHGAEKFKEDTGIAFRDFEIQNDTQREQAMRKFARDGLSPIVAIGFSQASAMEKVAAEFPKTQFVIVDMVVDKPNVQSIVFKEQEGSFLVGLLAAKASKTGKVGFVGGMDIPLIHKFSCGYVQGVKYADPKAEGVAKHDRHHGRGLDRSGEGRRTREVADRSGVRTWSITRPAPRASVCCGPRPMRGNSASGSIQIRMACFPGKVLDLHAQARRRCGLQELHDRQGRRLEARYSGSRAEGRRRRFSRSTNSTRT